MGFFKIQTSQEIHYSWVEVEVGGFDSKESLGVPIC